MAVVLQLREGLVGRVQRADGAAVGALARGSLDVVVRLAASTARRVDEAS